MSFTQSLMLIVVIAGMTILLRFLPFLIFRKRTPQAVLYLGQVFPYAIMGMLVIYCLKDVDLFGESHGIPELLAVLAVIILHKWKHNTLISIPVGTVFYMVLVQTIFK